MEITQAIKEIIKNKKQGIVDNKKQKMHRKYHNKMCSIVLELSKLLGNEYKGHNVGKFYFVIDNYGHSRYENYAIKNQESNHWITKFKSKKDVCPLSFTEQDYLDFIKMYDEVKKGLTK